MRRFKVKSVLLAVLAAIIATCNAYEQPLLSIVGSEVIRQGEVYKLAVVGHNLRRMLTVNFKLAGTNDNGNYKEYNLKNKKIASDVLNNFVFNTVKLLSGKYSLTVDVYDPLMKAWYKETQALTFEESQVSIFILTDKGTYKAGDVVKFRLFSIDSETRPSNSPIGDITIFDPNSNRVTVFSNITFVKGKYENSIQLTANPALGTWKISATVDTDTFEKYIEVQDYVLPLYSVIVVSPSTVAYSDKTFSVKVNASYTYGQSVQGVAVVSFNEQTFFQSETPAVTKFKKTVTIDSGSVTFLVNIKTDLGVGSSGQSYDIEVVFTETLTRKTATASSQIDVLQFAYSGIFEGGNNFYVNTSFTCKFYLRKYDGTSAPAGTKVSVTITFSNYGYFLRPSPLVDVSGQIISPMLPPSKSTTKTYKLDVSGSIVIKFIPEDCDYIIIDAYSIIASNSSLYVSKSDPSSLAQNMIDLTVLTKSPRIGSVVNIKVKTTSKTQNQCFCQMISKGLIVKSKTVIFNKKQEGILKFTPTFAFAPSTAVICYFSDESGYLQTQQITIDLHQSLPNFLTLELSSATVKPGDNLTLVVSSTLESTVSLLAIDQSSLLLNSGNEFSKGDIMSDLSKYNNIESYDYWSLPQEQQQFRSINLFLIATLLPTPEYPVITTTEAPIRRFPIFFLEKGEIAQAGMVAEVPAVVPTGDSSPAPAAPRVRKNFVETFAWMDVDITENMNTKDKVRGVARVPIMAPDTITSFIFSGVSMNYIYGLGLPDLKQALTVFLQFFIQLTLPNHIKRGEIVVQDIIIFNYLPKKQTAIVSFSRNDVQFNIVEPEKDNWKVSEDKYWQEITSLPNQPIGLKIVIEANILGVIDIDVTAVGPLAGDSVHKTLNVIPEGIPKTISQSVLISKNESASEITVTLSCTLPQSAVKDTTSASATVVGDVMGDVSNNLEKLIQMSYGCGEQNMLNFVPNIVILIYLIITGKITAPLKAKTIAFAIDGYQRELTFCRSDGSFSAFGQSDDQGSTWLTAYVVKSFMMARPFIYIDPDVIKKALDFLLSKQNADGSFREDGRVIHIDMQGGSGNGLALTSYIALCLSANIVEYPNLATVLDKALNYIVANLDVTNVYDLSISCYALHEAGRSEFKMFYDIFVAMGIETGDQLMWQKPVENILDQNSWSYISQPRSQDIEITAYALESVIKVDFSKAVKIAKYLVSEKNKYGGYASSQDTVCAIKALADFAILITSYNGTLELLLTPDHGSAFTAQVNPGNLLTLQSYALDSLARQLVVFTGKGSLGTALVSFTCNFYELDPETSPRFNIEHQFVDSCKQVMKSQICVSYITRPGDEISNMVIMRMTFLSGYIYDTDTILDPSIIQKLDQVDGGTAVDVYFYSLTSTTICINLQSTQTSVVNNLKVASITLTDYYDTTRKAQIVYNAPENLVDCGSLPNKTTAAPDSNPGVKPKA